VQRPDRYLAAVDHRRQTGITVVVLASVSHSNDGLHTISHYSIDNAGNTDAGYKVCTVNIATR
jgi:hypothetical protein